MSANNKSITPSREKIIYQTRLHWVLFLESVGILLIAILINFAGYRISGGQYHTYGNYLSLPFWAYGGVKFLLEWIQNTSSDFVVTSNRIVIRVGVLKRSSLSMPLSKIESIEVDQTILGQMLGYGSIHITGTGTATSKFDFISNPGLFRQKIQLASGGGASEELAEKMPEKSGNSYRRRMRRR
jgi:membrane protein YdbS with pleckstrin-like domain